MTTKKIYSLQLLRAIAVLLVVCIHVVGTSGSASANSLIGEFHFFKAWGAIGVDLFFAISGFIMVTIAPSYLKPGQWKTFLLKRIVRIVPLYLLVSCLQTILLFIKGTPPDWTAIVKTLVFLPLQDNHKFIMPILEVGWTLSFEVYFYILFALFLILNQSQFIKLFFLLVSLSIVGIFIKSDNALINFYFSPMLTEFALGIIAAIFFNFFTNKQPSSKSQELQLISSFLIILGLVLMIFTLFTGFGKIPYPDIILTNSKIASLRLLIWGVPSAIFLLGVVMYERFSNIHIPETLVKIGDASFSIYLIHIMIIRVTARLSLKFHLSPDIFIMVCISIIILCGWLCYKYIEKPLTEKIDYYLFKRNKIKKQISQG